jgi:hypothetical protein
MGENAQPCDGGSNINMCLTSRWDDGTLSDMDLVRRDAFPGGGYRLSEVMAIETPSLRSTRRPLGLKRFT